MFILILFEEKESQAVRFGSRRKGFEAILGAVMPDM